MSDNIIFFPDRITEVQEEKQHAEGWQRYMDYLWEVHLEETAIWKRRIHDYPTKRMKVKKLKSKKQ
jgi:hypothetical protein